MHEQPVSNRLPYLNKIQGLMKANGKFICEHAISHKNLMFYEDDLLFDESTNLLYQKNGDETKIVKYIPKAIEIEEQLVTSNFSVLEFKCDPSKKIICNRADPRPRACDPDHLFFCVQKKLN